MNNGLIALNYQFSLLNNNLNCFYLLINNSYQNHIQIFKVKFEFIYLELINVKEIYILDEFLHSPVFNKSINMNMAWTYLAYIWGS